MNPSAYALVSDPHPYDEKYSPAVQGLEKTAVLQAYCMYRKPCQAHLTAGLRGGVSVRDK